MKKKRIEIYSVITEYSMNEAFIIKSENFYTLMGALEFYRSLPERLKPFTCISSEIKSIKLNDSEIETYNDDVECELFNDGFEEPIF